MKKYLVALCAVVLLIFMAHPVYAEEMPTLRDIVAVWDGDATVSISGWSTPGATISVGIGNNGATYTVPSDGAVNLEVTGTDNEFAQIEARNTVGIAQLETEIYKLAQLPQSQGSLNNQRVQTKTIGETKTTVSNAHTGNKNSLNPTGYSHKAIDTQSEERVQDADQSSHEHAESFPWGSVALLIAGIVFVAGAWMMRIRQSSHKIG